MSNFASYGLVGRVSTITWRVVCALILAFLILPILAIIPLSFNSSPYFSYPMPGYSLKWYREFFGNAEWQLALRNSVIVGLCSTVLATTLGTAAAFGLNRANFPLKRLVMAILISPMVVPIVITAVGMFYAYARVGLTNNLLGIVIAHTALGVPFTLITVSAVLAGFDRTLTRAASSLGAGPLRTFREVTLPIIAPGVISGALFAFVTSWDEVVVVLFLSGVEQQTLPRRMWSGIREYINPTLLAAATLMVLCSILLMAIMELIRRRTERLRGGGDLDRRGEAAASK
jgi:putative spermidine/putrescine transport system permease protein